MSLSSTASTNLIAAAGIVIIMLSAGAALLPVAEGVPAATIGTLLIAAGLIEAAAGWLRKDGRGFALAAALVTTFAGMLFLVNRTSYFVPTLNLVAGWLLLRSLVLAAAAYHAASPVRTWLAVAALTDVLLGLVLIAGLSIATLVVSLFGPTPQLIASFSWVFAWSFVATGMLLLQVASCEREAAA